MPRGQPVSRAACSRRHGERPSSYGGLVQCSLCGQGQRPATRSFPPAPDLLLPRTPGETCVPRRFRIVWLPNGPRAGVRTDMFTAARFPLVRGLKCLLEDQKESRKKDFTDNPRRAHAAQRLSRDHSPSRSRSRSRSPNSCRSSVSGCDEG